MAEHQKHTALEKATFGSFGRNELSILGTPCGNIKQLAREVIKVLGGSYQVAYVDADHKSADDDVNASHLVLNGGAKLVTDKIDFLEMDWHASTNPFQQKKLFQDQDLVIINGNHFESKNQVVVIDSKKPLEKKLHKLSNPVLVLLIDEEIPGYLEDLVKEVPVLHFHETEKIAAWIEQFVRASIPPVYGLVLAGGKSTRMEQDKGLIDYHGMPQRDFTWKLLDPFCEEVYTSCRDDQASAVKNPLTDTFTGLGPFGGILSAFRKHPNVAWLTVASDLPFADQELIQSLLAGRNPSKVATAYWDPQHEFPEPLITIWEPRAYPELLHFLSLGYSCPRKALINSNVELIEASDTRKLMNVNYPEEMKEVMEELKQ